MAVTPQDFPGSVTQQLDQWLEAVLNGEDGAVPPGAYVLEAGVVQALNASASIHVSAGAEFIAAPGFPAGQRMFMVTTGDGADHVFRWIGGRFNAVNQPNSGPGQANDIFSFNAVNCDVCTVKLDRTFSGAYWTQAGSDSHLFIAGPSNIRAHTNAIGAKDCAIYISGPGNGERRHSAHVTGNFRGCSVGAIVKREFDVGSITANAVDCLAGVATGVANGIASGRGWEMFCNALRTETAINIQDGARGGHVTAITNEMGASVPGYTSGNYAYGLRINGARGVRGSVVAQGVNPACIRTTGYRGADCSREASIGPFDATDNWVDVHCEDIGKAFHEDANAARNFFEIKERNSLAASTPNVANGSSVQAR